MPMIIYVIDSDLIGLDLDITFQTKKFHHQLLKLLKALPASDITRGHDMEIYIGLLKLPTQTQLIYYYFIVTTARQ